MFHGFTESPEKVEARKRRILAGYKPSKARAFVRNYPLVVAFSSLLLVDAVLYGLSVLAR